MIESILLLLLGVIIIINTYLIFRYRTIDSWAAIGLILILVRGYILNRVFDYYGLDYLIPFWDGPITRGPVFIAAFIMAMYTLIKDEKFFKRKVT